MLRFQHVTWVTSEKATLHHARTATRSARHRWAKNPLDAAEDVCSACGARRRHVERYGGPLGRPTLVRAFAAPGATAWVVLPRVPPCEAPRGKRTRAR